MDSSQGSPRSQSNGTVYPTNTIKGIAISAFILFHIVAIFFWAVPLNSVLFTRISGKFAPYMYWSGLSQGWGMFCPEPLSINSYLEAEITYRDGRTSAWKFPMPQNFGYVRRYFKERDRKWATDHVRMDANAFLWPDVARYVARLNNDPKNAAVTVKLVRYWSQIAPPKSGQPEPWNRYVFFTYTVMPGDLL